MIDMFKCSVCNYIHEGASAPDHCPKCGAPKEKFVELTTEAADKVQRSRYTNDLHMELKLLLDTVEELSEQGIEDNLDPSCVKIFTEARDFAAVLTQKIKAELEGHMKKDKWG